MAPIPVFNSGYSQPPSVGDWSPRKSAFSSPWLPLLSLLQAPKVTSVTVRLRRRKWTEGHAEGGTERKKGTFPPSLPPYRQVLLSTGLCVFCKSILGFTPSTRTAGKTQAWPPEGSQAAVTGRPTKQHSPQPPPLPLRSQHRGTDQLSPLLGLQLLQVDVGKLGGPHLTQIQFLPLASIPGSAGLRFMRKWIQFLGERKMGNS